MKTQLSALDIYLLAKELKELLPARIQKIYDLKEKGLELNFYPFSEKEEKKLILMPPHYFYLTSKSYPHKKHPSSFVMLLRKHLENGTLREVNQHNLDRILELEIEQKHKKFFLISEFFSKGNIFLCKEEGKILGLWEWQKWKHRTLGVGKKYKYPPSLPNPSQINFSKFKEILQKSSTSLAGTLVRKLNLGKTLSEELCLNSNLEKEKESKNLAEDEYEKIFNSLQKLLQKFKEEKINPRLIVKDEKPVDVAPFELEIYQGRKWKKKNFSTFHGAIKEYFTFQEKKKTKVRLEKKFQEEIKNLNRIKEDQEKVIEKLQEEQETSKKIAQLIYHNLPTVEKILNLVRKTQDKDKLIGEEINGIKIKEVKGNSLLIEI